MVVLVVFKFGLEGNQAVLTPNIDHVVYSPIHLSDSPGWMPKSLKGVHQNDPSSDTDSDALDGFKDRVDHMGTSFKYIGPDIVEEVQESIFTAETLNSESQVLDSGSCSLPVNKIPISESILKQRGYCINVIFGHFSDIFEHEGQTFQHSVLNV